MRQRLHNLVGEAKKAMEDRNLRMLFATNFTRTFGMSVINPIMPLFIRSLGADKLGVSMVLSASSAASIFLLVPCGLLADRYGRKKTIVASTILSLLPPFFFAVSTSWQQIIPWAILFSVSITMYFPAKDSIIADYTTPKNRAMFYGAINLALCMASIVGPAAGGFIADRYGWASSFYLIILTTLLCLPFALSLTETTGRGPVPKEERQTKGARPNFLRILVIFVFYYTFLGIALAIVLMAIPLYLEDKFQMTKAQVGLFFSVGTGVTSLFTQIPSGRIVRKFGGQRALLAYILMIPPTFLLWPSVQSPFVLLILMIIYGVFYTMTWVAEATLIMSLVPTPLRGFSSAVTQTGLAVGRTLGPMVVGLIWSPLGPEAVFYSAALFFALCALPILMVGRTAEYKRNLKLTTSTN